MSIFAGNLPAWWAELSISMDQIPIEIRFWSKVEVVQFNNCWIWRGAKDSKGYGHIRENGKHHPAHRLAWELYNKQPFPEGKFACHKCDNPPCVNPEHIWPGTPSQNLLDAVIKKRTRHPTGIAVHTSKLNEKLVIEILSKYRTGTYSYKRLAKEYGVSFPTIRAIIKNETWKHIDRSAFEFK